MKKGSHNHYKSYLIAAYTTLNTKSILRKFTKERDMAANNNNPSLLSIESSSSSEAYKNFINSVDSEATKKCYKYTLSLFMKYYDIDGESYDSMLTLPKLEDRIRDYITYLKVDKQLSSNSVNLYVAAISHFYAMNNVTLNWKRLSKFKGKKRMKVEDKPYAKEQIRQLLDFADLRLKCIILLMCSAGLRRGAIPLLRVGDLEKIPKYGLYKISVYKKEQEAYYTFCTPECAKALDHYFDFRARLGEKIHDKSLVFRKEFNSLNIAKPQPLAVNSISWLINKLLDTSGIRPRQEKKDRTSIMQCHGFRKTFETTARLAGMDLVLINRCMGHSSGLEDSYLKLSEEQVLEGNDKMIGYVGVINALTINDEERLKLQIHKQEQQRDELTDIRMQQSAMREMMTKLVSVLSETTDQTQINSLSHALATAGILRPSNQLKEKEDKKRIIQNFFRVLYYPLHCV